MRTQQMGNNAEESTVGVDHRTVGIKSAQRHGAHLGGETEPF